MYIFIHIKIHSHVCMYMYIALNNIWESTNPYGAALHAKKIINGQLQ